MLCILMLVIFTIVPICIRNNANKNAQSSNITLQMNVNHVIENACVLTVTRELVIWGSAMI